MPVDLSKTFVIGISSRALFDLEAENLVFLEQGLAAYRQLQLERENVLLEPGPGFPLVKALLALNEIAPGGRRCEVVVMSKNSADISLRIFDSIKHHNLNIIRAALVSGASLAPYLRAFSVDLFLSRDHSDVQAGIDAGVASAVIYDTPPDYTARLDQIRIAFDADAVLFSDESETVYKNSGPRSLSPPRTRERSQTTQGRSVC
jgi:5'-nucleotidase